jgi:hypothetical protein
MSNGLERSLDRVRTSHNLTRDRFTQCMIPSMFLQQRVRPDFQFGSDHLKSGFVEHRKFKLKFITGITRLDLRDSARRYSRHPGGFAYRTHRCR